MSQTKELEAPSHAPPGYSPPARFDPRIALSPVLATLVVLAIHVGLSNRQLPSSYSLYPRLLQVLLGATLLAAAAQGFFPQARRRAREFAPLLTAALLLLGVWDLTTRKLDLLSLPYFPGPDKILEALYDDRKDLLESTGTSLVRVLCGYSAGVVAGLITGILMGWFRGIRYWGMPVMKLVGPIPATAFVPLAMVAFDNPFFSGLALIALSVWFPVTMLTMSGIANVPSSYFDVARTLGAGRSYLIFHVAVPAALPTIFIGLFMGLGAAFLTLIVAETVGVSSGLGWYLKWRQSSIEYGHMYAALLIMSLFFSSLMTLLFKTRDWFLGWQKGMIRW